MKSDIIRFSFVAGVAVAMVNILGIVQINWWYDVALFAIAYHGLLKSLAIKVVFEAVTLPLYYISYQPRHPNVDYEVYMLAVYYAYYRLINKWINKIKRK